MAIMLNNDPMAEKHQLWFSSAKDRQQKYLFYKHLVMATKMLLRSI
jgi:hypothetical protein